MSALPRWLALLAVVAIVAIAAAFTLRRAFTPAVFVIESLPDALPADGFSTTQLRIRSPSGRNLDGVEVVVDDSHRAAI